MKFVRPGKELIVQESSLPSLDEYGRSYTTGSKKTARSQVWLIRGTGEIVINGKPLRDYFSLIEYKETAMRPLFVVNRQNHYNVWGMVQGGGPSGKIIIR